MSYKCIGMRPTRRREAGRELELPAHHSGRGYEKRRCSTNKYGSTSGLPYLIRTELLINSRWTRLTIDFPATRPHGEIVRCTQTYDIMNRISFSVMETLRRIRSIRNENRGGMNRSGRLTDAVALIKPHSRQDIRFHQF